MGIEKNEVGRIRKQEGLGKKETYIYYLCSVLKNANTSLSES